VLGFCTLQAQNLVPNPSFEDVNICTEFNAPCAPAAWLSVAPDGAKLDYMFHQYPGGAGNNLVRLTHLSQDGLRNYAQTKLLCPLEKGRRYRVTLVGWQDGETPPETGLRFDTTWLFREAGSRLANLKPTLQLGPADVVKQTGGKKVFTLQREFVAEKQYACLVIGTFTDQRPSPHKTCNYIDSIAITPVSDAAALCASAQKTRDSLYAGHRRHSIPTWYYHASESRRRQLEGRNLQCITIPVKDHTIFSAAGRAREPEAAARLDSIVKAYNPATGMQVRLTGHSFREGSFNYNKVLAESNAKKIMELLIYMKGFSYEDITVDSKGNTQPRYDTATAEGRERNNFVDMEFCMPRPPGAPPEVAVHRPDTLLIPDVLFRTNSSELNKHLFAELDSLVQLIPASGPVQLQLVGHTDNRGEEEYNQALSHRRALAVAEYLETKGWGNYIRHVSGEGEKRPLAGNDTEVGRQRNRRVEIIIYRGSE
jgi:outer membrane protein OmpA-like peptidoglycan-associated protein